MSTKEASEVSKGCTGKLLNSREVIGRTQSKLGYASDEKLFSLSKRKSRSLSMAYGLIVQSSGNILLGSIFSYRVVLPTQR